MAFWDNWTKKKETHTNAPAHWPKLAIEFDDRIRTCREPFSNAVSIDRTETRSW
jgi:hypothetical protein